MSVETNNKPNENIDVELDNEEETGANGAGAEDNGDGGEGADGGAGKGGAAEKTFTQQQVTKMMAKEKRQGRAAALRELGLDPKDTKTISLLQSILKGSKGAEAESESAGKLAEAEQRAQMAEAKAEALKLGCNPSFVDDVATLAMAKFNAEEGGEMSSIIEELKAKYASMFTTNSGEGAGGSDDDGNKGGNGGKPVGQRGTGASIKGGANRKKEEEKGSFGRRLAAQRKTTTTKKSYWG